MIFDFLRNSIVKGMGRICTAPSANGKAKRALRKGMARGKRKDGEGACREKGTISVALAGNPNVGKSTLFNTLTGMHRHTGNWSGKSVDCEAGASRFGERDYLFVDIPGTYSLLSHSEEERIARDYIAFGEAEVVCVVCDGTSLMQNLNLVLQITEIGRPTVVVLNFMDEARRSGIEINTEALAAALDVPVVSCAAHKRRDMGALVSAINGEMARAERKMHVVLYSDEIERAVKMLTDSMSEILTRGAYTPTFLRWVALRLIDSDAEMEAEIFHSLSLDRYSEMRLSVAADGARQYLYSHGIDGDGYKDAIVGRLVSEAERIADKVTVSHNDGRRRGGDTADRILTGRVTAYPVMLFLLALVFFITLLLANYPSELISRFFEFSEDKLRYIFDYYGAVEWVSGALLSGVFRTLGRVVSVMLPPMAIFFPLFAILEDSGYLPRIAYNLDRPFSKAGACGKQALTMCMGFGCNAVGIVGARIIDSRRERMLAILTNSLVPCNGRLPMLITLLSVLCIFLCETASAPLVAALLTAFILLGIAATFFATSLLSHTALRGERSAFTIELPPYRRPRFIKVILRSLLTKCISILARAVVVAAPMGLLIWILANVTVGGESLILLMSGFLDPVGKLFGMDGEILLSFILGLPANEIVIPIMLMIYSSGGAMIGEVGAFEIGDLLLSVGWTPVTALCAAIFALFHWPCSTSLITVYKETKSVRATVAAALIPTAVGLILCLFVNLLSIIFI